MKRINALLFGLCMATLTACSSQNVLTEQEIKTQNAADSVVAELLFEKELEVTASYHVRKTVNYFHLHSPVSFKVHRSGLSVFNLLPSEPLNLEHSFNLNIYFTFTNPGICQVCSTISLAGI